MQPNGMQINALKQFADKYGRFWKDELLNKWLDGSDAREPQGHLLRQVRNTFGPQWLQRFALNGAVEQLEQAQKALQGVTFTPQQPNKE